jgi:hypothetical protein
MSHPPASFLPLVVANMIEQNASHHRGRDTKKMGAILPMDPVLVDQSNVCLVYKNSRLKRISGPKAPKIIPSESSKLPLDKGEQLV